MNEVFFLKDHIVHVDDGLSLLYRKGVIAELDHDLAAILVAGGVAKPCIIEEDDLIDGRWSEHDGGYE